MKKSCYKRHCAQLKTLSLFFKKQSNKEQDKVIGYELFTRFSLDSVSLATTSIIVGIARYGLMANFAGQFFSKLGACLDTFIDSQLAVNLLLYNIEKLNLLTLFSNCFAKMKTSTNKVTLEIAEQDCITISEKAATSLYQLKRMSDRISLENSQQLISLNKR